MDLKSVANYVSEYSAVRSIVGDGLIGYFDTEGFLETLYKRSKDNGQNIEIANLGPNIAWLPKAVMVSGPWLQPFIAIAGYGEGSLSNSENPHQTPISKEKDPAARKVFDVVETLLGFPTINNLQGNQAILEKAKIKKHMQASDANSITTRIFSNLFANWNGQQAFNTTMRHATMQVLAKALFGLPDVDVKYVKPLTEISDLITNPWVRPEALQEANENLQKLSDQLLKETFDEIDFTKYASDFAGIEAEDDIEIKKEKLKKKNIAGSFIAATNLADLIMKTIAEINDQAEVKKRILEDKDYLKRVFEEAQRLFSPSVVARRNSRTCHLSVKNQQGEIKEYAIPPHSYLFAPIRPRHLDEALWENPLKFNPDRFLNPPKNNKEIPKLFTFSGGRRTCPAGIEFAEIIFNAAIIAFCESGRSFVFNKKPEHSPVFAIKTSWEEEYLASYSTPKPA